MDIKDYKNLCKMPNSFRRSQLEKTSNFLKDKYALTSEINRILSTKPIEKPKDFFGDASDDFFIVKLDAAVIAGIVNELMILEGIFSEENYKSETLNELTDLVDAWNEILLQGI